MSDEPEDAEYEVEAIPAGDDSERFAVAMYQSHTAELAQAFGNLLAQALPMQYNHPLMSVTLSMLEKVAGSVDVKPKGALRTISKD